MAFTDPYAVDGATVGGAMLRGALFESTHGETGITGPTALRVEGLAGGQVGIGPGSGVIGVESRRESYRVSNTAMDGDAVLDVPVAGSSGATWFVVVEVNDPQYHGQEPATTARLAGSRPGPGGRPHVVLARIRLGPGETVGPTSDIADLREIANPRAEHYFWMHRVSSGQVDVLTGTQTWPDAFTREVDIPTWATRAIVSADFGMVLMPAGGFSGAVWVALDTADDVRTADVPFEGGDVAQKVTIPAGDTIGIPGRARGTTGVVRMRGRRISGSNSVSPMFRSGSSARVWLSLLESPQ